MQWECRWRMKARTKKFDCVEMKRRAQEKILAEYEARKSEFGSYWQFLQARTEQSPWQQEFLARLKRRPAKAQKSTHAGASPKKP